MTDQKGAETVPFYFGPTPRLSVLYFAVTHTYEHYGNLVTYMRLEEYRAAVQRDAQAGALALSYNRATR